MKKYLALFLVIVLMVCFCLPFSCVLAEDAFSFRNGIHLGDSMDSVREKEDNSGKLSEDENHLWYSELELSGIGDSLLSYMFANDKLVCITLSYGCNMSIGKAKTDYEKINDGLIRKYGNPIENEEDIKPFPDGLFKRSEPIFNEPSIKNQEIYGKNQWTVPIEDEKILVIEHIALSYSSGFFTNVLHCLEYQYMDEKQGYDTAVVDNDL